MWSANYRRYAAAGIIVVIAAVAAAPRALEQISMRLAAHACAESGQADDRKVDCWEQIALNYVRRGDVPAAYRVFDYLYEAYPSFGAWGCHVNAHRLGDAAYYQFFVTHGLSLPQMDFPQETTSCGYGFFHGFIEHLIQDHPQTSYAIETCEYLRGRLSADMHDIARICYHASGHGFIQAVADTLTKSQWGRTNEIANGPLEKCEAMPGVSAEEIEECREGVYNVLSDWMIEKNFGLAFDFEHPFKSCDSAPARWRWACYYEFGQKLQPVIGDRVLSGAEYVGSIRDPAVRGMTFGVIVAGMMQRLAPLDQYEAVFTDCTKVTDDVLFSVCIRSATNGMMEHGDPGREYEKVLPVCSLPELMPRDGARICYDTLARRLSRFYQPEKKTRICSMFPVAYRTDCEQAP